MLKTNCTIACRNLWKHKTFSFLNVMGLSIGILASLTIYLLAAWDFGYEQEVQDKHRIYRMVSVFTNKSGNSNGYTEGMPLPLINQIHNNIPGVETSAPIHFSGDETSIMMAADKGTSQKFKKEKGIIYTTPSYFELFAHSWIAGIPSVALDAPFKMVITTLSADKYFPGTPYAAVVGKVVYLADTIPITISGIIAPREDRTHFDFNGFISYSTLSTPAMQPDYWNQWRITASENQFFYKLATGSSSPGPEKYVSNLFVKNSMADKYAESQQTFIGQALTEMHFDNRFSVFGHRLGHKPTLYGLLTIAGFLLLLGCINFINLSTAQSFYRCRETGIRKTLGGTRKQLMLQFLTESFLLTLMATIAACLLVPLVLRLFADFLPDGLQFPQQRGTGICFFLPALVLAVSFLSGFYPAFVLSSFQPVQVLKNQATGNTANSGKTLLRKTLTVSQFVVAQVFVIATLLVGKQISFSLNKEIGLRKDGIVFFHLPYGINNFEQKKELLASKIRLIPGLEQLSIAGPPASSSSTGEGGIQYDDSNTSKRFNSRLKSADTNYLRIYNIQLLAGRNFLRSDSLSELLINQAFLRETGLQNPDEAIGKTVMLGQFKAVIAGVVKDFHSSSLHWPIGPLALTNDGQKRATMHALLQPSAKSGIPWQKTLASIKKEFTAVFPGEDYNLTFFDESIAKFYEAEQNTSKLLGWASGLAIFISCLGLLGLITFTTVQRTKEIGVRKVLGASVTQIVQLLSKEIIVLVIIALLVAMPLAWIGLNQWLNQFAYRTEISWWLFVLTGIVTLLIAILTLSFQTIRAALSDPVKCLRTE